MVPRRKVIVTSPGTFRELEETGLIIMKTALAGKTVRIRPEIRAYKLFYTGPADITTNRPFAVNSLQTETAGPPDGLPVIFHPEEFFLPQEAKISLQSGFAAGFHGSPEMVGAPLIKRVAANGFGEPNDTIHLLSPDASFLYQLPAVMATAEQG